MTEARPARRPLAAPACPLCGGPNGCAPAASGRFDTPCWCLDLRFPPELLARVPADQRDRACICRACVEAHAAVSAAPAGPTERG